VKKVLICPECGQKNISKLKVCNRCGASLRPVESGWTQQEYTETPEDTEQSPPDADFSNLMTCPDCKREVSRNAPNCPGCGAPIAAGTTAPKKGDLVPGQRKTSPFTWFMTGLLALAFFIAISQDRGEPVKSGAAHSPLTKPITPKLNRPHRYLHKRSTDIAAIFGVTPNDVGNVIYDKGPAQVLFESSDGTYISFINVQFMESVPCSQTRGFQSNPFLRKLGVDVSELVLIRKQKHFHTFDHPNSKTRVTVSCDWEGGPISVGFGSKYFGTR